MNADPSEHAFSQFFRNSREAMYITSRDGMLIDFNNALIDLFGFDREEILGRHVAALLDNEEDREEFQRSIEAAGVVHNYALALRRKDQSVLLGMIDAVVWHEGGKVAGYHGIIRTREAITESYMIHLDHLKEEKRLLREERRNLVSDAQILSRYLTDDLIKYMNETGANPLKSARHSTTVLFFDIRSSTGIAERTSPEDFASFLSDILTDIMDLVYGCKGSVNKLLGDGLMATFGTPVSGGKDALNAVDAALKIQNYLVTFNDVRPDFLVDPVSAGIGIASGSVFAGLIGSVRRQEYAVLGDPVNVASRLESLTKTTGESILMDEATYVLVKDQIPCKPLYRGKLRGKEETLRIYGVVR